MRTNRHYSFILTHFPRDTNFLKHTVAMEELSCSVCFYPIEISETYWYIEPQQNPKYICYRCKHNFEPTGSLNRPYWLTKPNIGSCSNIRTQDDKGQRELLDKIVDEWDAIWSNDVAGTRFP